MPTPKQVTVICCTNNIKALKNELMKSLSTQTVPYDLIVINNKDHSFSSCSAAYNSAICKVKTKYVIFSHQDITLLKNDTLEKYIEYLDKIKTGDILGVAGTQFNIQGVLTSIFHGKINQRAGKRMLHGIAKCDTLDECFFGGLTETFIKYPFNEKLCDDWHLYSVERCLHNKARGHNVYVCECDLLHSSTGKVTYAFYSNFRRLCKAYNKYYPEIYTTCARSKTDLVSRNVSFIKYDVKLFIKSIVKKFLKKYR